MSSIAVLKAFYTQLGSVLNNLIDMFPDDMDFKTFRTFVGMIQSTNPQLVVSTFYTEVVDKYEAQIDSRDEAFLVAYEGAEYGNDVVDIMTKIKSYWASLDAESKDSLWQYLFILKELAKRAYVKQA